MSLGLIDLIVLNLSSEKDEDNIKTEDIEISMYNNW